MQYFTLTEKIPEIIGSCKDSDRPGRYLVSVYKKQSECVVIIPIICSTLPNKL